MSTKDDKAIAWQGRIQERAAHATKAILDRLATMPKSGLNNLTPNERRDLSETIAKQIVDTMGALGTFVTAGAQDFQVCHLEGVNIGKAGKVSLKLTPQATESGGVNLGLLAANADKQVVVAMINGLAYSQAREALSKAITREQTDWVQRSQDTDMAEQETVAEIEAETEARPDGNLNSTPSDSQAPVEYDPGFTSQPTGDLIAEQPGDGDGEQENAGEQEPATNAEAIGATAESRNRLEGGIPGSEDGSSVGAGRDDSGSPQRPGESNDSPLARAGRRVRRRTADADRPATH